MKIEDIEISLESIVIRRPQSQDDVNQMTVQGIALTGLALAKVARILDDIRVKMK